jgi:SWIM zinc finger
MSDRWSRTQVLALAPDAASQRTAEGLASPRRWSELGCYAGEGGVAAIWGACQGSGAKPYRSSVDLSGPAYRCTCPSRKFPCKHALALLLLWSDGGVPVVGGLPAWVAEWVEQRLERDARATARSAARSKGTSDPEAARRRAAQREGRVAAGLDDLDRWLRDQVRHGLAEAERAGYRHWETTAARLVDAQAPGPAGVVRRLAGVPRSGEGWPGRLLEEYALLRLLVVAARRLPDLSEELRQTVRSRVGFTVARDEVLGGPTVRDRWDVLGRHDFEEDGIRIRRVWLRGRERGRDALVLSFAAVPGQSLDASLVTGTAVDADLAYYPGTPPLRALVANRHATSGGQVPRGGTVAALLAGYAAALACDPWLDTWPAVLAGARLARAGAPPGSGGWMLVDPDGAALPLHPEAGHPWRLAALSGGRPVTVAGEWTPHGLLPLTVWDPGGQVALL